MNEEAGFIDALLADPDDRTVLLVYADWLDERADPRAEYLRLVAKPRPNQRRLAQLRRLLDANWVHTIDTRCVQAGARVRVLEGSFRNCEGQICALTADRQTATVVVTFWGRPLDVELLVSQLEVLAPEVG